MDINVYEVCPIFENERYLLRKSVLADAKNELNLVRGKTENLGAIYNEIYKEGPLLYEIEEFDNKGNCKIRYYR